MPTQRFLLLLLAVLIGNISVLTAQTPAPANNEDEYRQEFRKRVSQDRLFGVYIPADTEEALSELTRLSDGESRRSFMAQPEDRAYAALELTLGRWIVTNWGLHGGSRLSVYFGRRGLRHPDDVAHYLILAWHRQLTGKLLWEEETIEQLTEARRAAVIAERRRGTVIDSTVRLKKPD